MIKKETLIIFCAYIVVIHIVVSHVHKCQIVRIFVELMLIDLLHVTCFTLNFCKNIDNST